jgi:hypothetical protein
MPRSKPTTRYQVIDRFLNVVEVFSDASSAEKLRQEGNYLKVIEINFQKAKK